MTLLTTSPDGDIITTGSTEGSGLAIAVDYPTSNDDIQIFDFSVDLLKVILWEYNKALNAQGLLVAMQNWFTENQTNFWQNWVRDVFDLRTANEFGLSVWSIILQIPLFVNTPPDPDKPTFGFDLPSYGNFDNSNFTDSEGSSYDLPIETKRLALRLRYFQLVTCGAVPEVNRFLAYLFADYGQVYLADYGNMTQAYVFNFPVPADWAYLFNNFDILPRPAGVGSTWIDSTLQYFGFEGSNHVNFDNGVLGA